MSDERPILDRKPSLSPASAWKAAVEQVSALSEPPAVKQSRLYSEAAVDIAGIIAVSLLLITKSLPGLELHALGLMAYIVGGAQLLQYLGKRGSIVLLTLGPLGWLLKAAAASRVVMALPLAFMLGGCAALMPLASSALQALAPVAFEAIRDRLEQAPAPVTVGGRALCVALPDDYQPDHAAIVACYGADLTAAVGPAGEALLAAAAQAGESVDRDESLCERVPSGALPGALVVCGGVYVE